MPSAVFDKIKFVFPKITNEEAKEAEMLFNQWKSRGFSDTQALWFISLSGFALRSENNAF